MTQTPKEHLSVLRSKIEQQRIVVESLKREGHEHTDAERQLCNMLADLKLSNDNSLSS